MMERTFEGFGNHEGASASEDNSKAHQMILGCDRDLDGKINLAEYLMMRRALIAWNECAQETMNRAGLRCALNITTTDHRNVDQAEADTAFAIGISMQDYKNGLSFPVFLMIADLYRTFTSFDVPADNGYIGKKQLIRSLNESELPHRITEAGIKAIFDAIGQNEINFPTFCFSVVIYNRWYQYSTILGVPNNDVLGVLNLDQFLALMHDTLIPDYVRIAIDTISVNIPTDQMVYSMQRLVAGGGGGAMSMSFNVQAPPPVEEEEEKTTDYTEKSFVLNFLQKKTKEGGDCKDDDKECKDIEEMNEKLKEKGLATSWKDERRQRAIVYAIINTKADDALSFKAFFNMVKLAKIYMTGAYKDNLDQYKSMLSPTEVKNIELVNQTIGTRVINFKHLLTLLNAKDIFDRFEIPGVVQEGLTREDIEEGLGQMSYPMMKIAAHKYKGSTNAQGQTLYKPMAVFVDTMFAEIDALMNMYLGHKSSTLMKKINSRNFVDWWTDKSPYKKEDR